MSVFEMATFRFKPEIDEGTARSLWQDTQSFARAQPGYLSRRLLKGDADTWIDLVEWTDMDAAKAAGAAFQPTKHPELAGFAGAMDMSSLSMQHFLLAGQAE